MDLSLGTFIGQAGTFLVLVLVTMKFVWPPLTQAMEERRQKIAEGLARSGLDDESRLGSTDRLEHRRGVAHIQIAVRCRESFGHGCSVPFFRTSRAWAR